MASKKYDLSQSIKTLFISLIGMAVGAKLFGHLTGIYRDIGLGKQVSISSIRDTGIVYYGGLFGLITTYTLCLKTKRCVLDIYSLDVLAVCFPLFHAIARIGCLLSGCCYGRIYQGILAINYITIIEGSVDVNSRIPVQLLEALFEFAVFIYLLSLLHKESWQAKQLLLRYLAIYSVGRFVLEFFRGDYRRGIICGVSFSQCISIAIWITLITIYFRRKRIKKIEGGL